MDQRTLGRVARVSKYLSNEALPILWRRLHSAQPLIELIPEEAPLIPFLYYGRFVHELIIGEVTYTQRQRQKLFESIHLRLLPSLKVLVLSDDSSDLWSFGLGDEDLDRCLPEHLALGFLSASLDKVALGTEFAQYLDWGRIAGRCPQVTDLRVGVSFDMSPRNTNPDDDELEIGHTPQSHHHWEQLAGYCVTPKRLNPVSPSRFPPFAAAIGLWNNLSSLAFHAAVSPWPELIGVVQGHPRLQSLTLLHPHDDEFESWHKHCSPEVDEHWFPALRTLGVHHPYGDAAHFIFDHPVLLSRVTHVQWRVGSNPPPSGYARALVTLSHRARCLTSLCVILDDEIDFEEWATPELVVALAVLPLLQFHLTIANPSISELDLLPTITGFRVALRVMSIRGISLSTQTLAMIGLSYPQLQEMQATLSPPGPPSNFEPFINRRPIRLVLGFDPVTWSTHETGHAHQLSPLARDLCRIWFPIDVPVDHEPRLSQRKRLGDLHQYILQYSVP